MRLNELVAIVKKCKRRAGKLNPDVEFWLGEDTELHLLRLGQFHLVPDLVFSFTTSKQKADLEAKKPKEKCGCGT